MKKQGEAGSSPIKRGPSTAESQKSALGIKTKGEPMQNGGTICQSVDHGTGGGSRGNGLRVSASESGFLAGDENQDDLINLLSCLSTSCGHRLLLDT